MQGILNAGYHRDTAYVLRMGQPAPGSQSDGQSSALACFSCWCPKVISQIRRLPETLADRCIVFRMQRKTPNEQCERLRNFDTTTLRRQCARFVLDHGQAITNARPELPESLNDRAADIWEPLLALADLAGGEWPALARQAAIGLSAGAQESNPVGSLLLDIFILFFLDKSGRIFSRTLVAGLNGFADRPWAELRNSSEITERWLSHQLRPYGIRPVTLRIGETLAKGYRQQDFAETFRRYIPQSELDALKADNQSDEPPTPHDGTSEPPNSGPTPS